MIDLRYALINCSFEKLLSQNARVDLQQAYADWKINLKVRFSLNQQLSRFIRIGPTAAYLRFYFTLLAANCFAILWRASVYSICLPFWYCIVLYCIVLYCIVLYCIILYCIVLCTVLYCT